MLTWTCRCVRAGFPKSKQKYAWSLVTQVHTSPVSFLLHFVS